MKILWKSAVLVIGCASFLSAQEPVPPAFVKGDEEQSEVFDPDVNAPKLIRVQVEFIEVLDATMTKLLFGNGPEATDDHALRIKLQELMDKKEAKAVETQLVVCRNGQKSMVESVDEFIFPTEFEPGTESVPTPAENEKDAKPITKNIAPFTPTALETRNIGSTLEVEPTLSMDGKIIDLMFVPEIVSHTGEYIWAEQKDALVNIGQVQVPRIYTTKLTTSVTCMAGKYLLAGSVSPKNEAGNTDMSRKWLVFVKCDVLTVK